MTNPANTGALRRTRALLRAGAAAGPLFAAVFLIEGARRRGYDPRRHPVSSLSLGPEGWTQIANFAGTGIFVLCGSLGLHQAAAGGSIRRAGIPFLVGAAGLGLIGSALFPTDPVSGYPPGTPPTPDHPTRHGAAHNLAALPIFLGLPAAAGIDALSAARAGHPLRAAHSAASGAGMLATMSLFGAGFGQHPKLVGQAGLYQRISIACGFSWLTALCIRASRRPRAHGQP